MFEKVSPLINYLSFATKLVNIFKNLIENFSVRGEGRRGKGAFQLKAQVLTVALSRVKLLGGDPLFSGGAYLLQGVCKRYYTSLLSNSAIV